MIQRYQNTDLVLESAEDLTGLAHTLDGRCDVLYSFQNDRGLWVVSAEAEGSGDLDDPQAAPERDIASLLQVLESLDGEHREVLSRCTTFEFDIGWASADEGPTGRFALSAPLLGRIAAIGATVAATVYPSSMNEGDE